jgi:hypothetical protein
MVQQEPAVQQAPAVLVVRGPVVLKVQLVQRSLEVLCTLVELLETIQVPLFLIRILREMLQEHQVQAAPAQTVVVAIQTLPELLVLPEVLV